MSRSGAIFRLIVVAILSVGVFACSKSGSGAKGLGADGLSEADLAAQREGRFGGGGIPTAEGGGMFRDIAFDYDSSGIDDSARQNIEFNAQVLQQNSGIRIQLEGHCDERGTAEYNLALGNERARAVKSVLQSLGVSASKIETISYGEEVPLDSGHEESAWARNRRVHFSPVQGSPTARSAAGDLESTNNRF